MPLPLLLVKQQQHRGLHQVCMKLRARSQAQMAAAAAAMLSAGAAVGTAL
jgi:hypothetical protein